MGHHPLTAIYSEAAAALGYDVPPSSATTDWCKCGISDCLCSDIVTLFTPKGSAVCACQFSGTDLTPAVVAACNAEMDTKYGPCGATRETDCTRKYNCHSYAWHLQATSNTKWISTPDDDKYFTDRSYFKIATLSAAPTGAKVSYKCDDHSAIQASATTFRSKWGMGPRMLHPPTCTPYYYYCPRTGPLEERYQPNLILKKTATASASDFGMPASKANDGTTTSRWSSACSATGSEWWMADMGTTKTINNVQVMWETAYAKRHYIGTSTDCVNFYGYWYQVTTPAYRKYVLGDRTARCVLVYMTERAWPYCNYSFWEAEAFQVNGGSSFTGFAGGGASSAAGTEAIELYPSTGEVQMKLPPGEVAVPGNGGLGGSIELSPVRE